MVQRLQLTKGMEALVDDHVLDRLDGRWHASRSRDKWYAARSLPWTVIDKRKVRPKQYLHRFITGCDDPELIVDHFNGDSLDCTDANLIVCGYAWNNHNVRRNLSSKYRGVHTHHTGQWRARLGHKGEDIHIGLYDTEIEAARAYDELATELYGAWAMTNVREGRLPPLDPVAVLKAFGAPKIEVLDECPF